jgi:hypothetical protein
VEAAMEAGAEAGTEDCRIFNPARREPVFKANVCRLACVPRHHKVIPAKAGIHAFPNGH